MILPISKDDSRKTKFKQWYSSHSFIKVDPLSGERLQVKSITQVAIELGVSRQTVHSWIKKLDPHDEEILALKQNIINHSLTKIWNSIFLKAVSGDINAAEMFINAFDNSKVSSPDTSNENLSLSENIINTNS